MSSSYEPSKQAGPVSRDLTSVLFPLLKLRNEKTGWPSEQSHIGSHCQDWQYFDRLVDNFSMFTSNLSCLEVKCVNIPRAHMNWR